MEQFFVNLVTIFENAFIVIWYWINMYRWELLFFILMSVAVVFEYKEMKIHFIDDKRKVV